MPIPARADRHLRIRVHSEVPWNQIDSFVANTHQRLLNQVPAAATGNHLLPVSMLNDDNVPELEIRRVVVSRVWP